MLRRSDVTVETPPSDTIEYCPQIADAVDGDRFSKPHIVVIDDYPDGLECLSQLLAAEGFRVTAARSAEEALLHIHAACPDLIITDHMMPGITGVELCEHLRSHPQTCDIPVVLYTGATLSDRDTQWFDRAFLKPTDLAEFLATIRKLLLLDTAPGRSSTSVAVGTCLLAREGN
jgi:CheY-like chemotaxis protein